MTVNDYLAITLATWMIWIITGAILVWWALEAVVARMITREPLAIQQPLFNFVRVVTERIATAVVFIVTIAFQLSVPASSHVASAFNIERSLAYSFLALLYAVFVVLERLKKRSIQEVANAQREAIIRETLLRERARRRSRKARETE